MIPFQAIVIAFICAACAGFAQALTHQIARKHAWRRIPRYTAGISIICLAFAPVVFSVLPLESAATLYGLLWLIVGASGLATWLSYEADPPRSTSATPDADAFMERLNKELDE